MMMLTALQIRGARAMARLSLDELAERSGVSVSTLRRIENEHGVPTVQTDTIIKVYSVFKSLGFSFEPDQGDERGPGIFWGSYPGRSR